MIRIISKKDFNLPATTQWENHRTIGHILLLTILGLNGGVTCLASNLSQSISLKNGWSRMLCSPLAVQPSLFWQFFVMNCSTKHTNFMSMTVHTALNKGWGGGRKTLFKLLDNNFNSCIARAPSVRYPANHQQHTLGTRGFFSRATGSFVSSAEGRRHERRRLLRLDRNRKPRMKSLWHPGYQQHHVVGQN